MATTTNYGWDTPDDTDLVKDGAAAIRTLGSSVDTTTKALNPSTTLGDIEYRSATANTNTRLPLGTAGQVLKVNSGATAPEWATDNSGMSNPMTTTGDTIYSSSGSTPARLGIGTAGQVLTVNSGATAPEWGNAPVAGANWTLLNSGGTSLSGSTTTVSGISGKDKIMILWKAASTTSAGSYLYVRINTDTGSNYYSFGYVLVFDTLYDASGSHSASGTGGGAASGFELGTTGAATGQCFGNLLITGANSSGVKVMQGVGGSTSVSATDRCYSFGGYYDSSSTISSVSLRTDAGTFDNGTIYVYGSA
jgi:hypothetical protein